MKDGVLGEEEDFGDVEREEGGAFDAGLQRAAVSAKLERLND